MDYIPVYDGDVPDGPQVKISLNRLQTLGVKTEAAAVVVQVGDTAEAVAQAAGTEVVAADVVVIKPSSTSIN